MDTLPATVSTVSLRTFEVTYSLVVRYGSQAKTVCVSGAFELASDRECAGHCFASQWSVRLVPNLR